MITVRAYGRGGPAEIEASRISDHLADGDERLLWVDVANPDDADLSCLQAEFSLHPLAMEDVRNRQQRPKLEHYPTHAFLVAYSADLEEVDFFIGPNWLVSVRESDRDRPAWPVDEPRARFERSAPDPPTAGYLLYVLLDVLVDGYFQRTEKAEDDLEDLEEAIFSEQLAEENRMQQQLFGQRRQLMLFRRAVVPLREVVASLLRGEVKWIDEHTTTYLQDVYDHILRAVDQVDAQRELLGNAVDAHLAIISNRMNFVMKKMTSWGAILLGSTLVAGIYGMNFDNMPELHWRVGYPYALGLMVVVTLVLYQYFRRKDWL